MPGHLTRPSDREYFIDPWSEGFLQGDLFDDVPIAIAAPPDAVVIDEGNRRFVSGPFDSGRAMLVSPSCAIAAQGPHVPPGRYAHPARTLVPVRPLNELITAGAILESNVGNLRDDRLRNYLYLPESAHGPESAALLYMPVSLHHQVIADYRVAQLTSKAFWHLRLKLMAFVGGFLLNPNDLGDPPSDQQRTS